MFLCFCLCWELGLWPQSCEGEAFGRRDPPAAPPPPPFNPGFAVCHGGSRLLPLALPDVWAGLVATSALRLAAAGPEGSVSQVTAGSGGGGVRVLGGTGEDRACVRVVVPALRVA